MFARIGLLGLALAAYAPAANAEDDAMAAWAEQCADWDEWDKPGPPFQVYGNTWYVGTCGISAILVTGEGGHAVIDSGTEAGARIVAANIEALGFRIEDVSSLMMSHEHHDHIGGLKVLADLTGALLVASPEAAEAIRKGGPVPADPQFALGDGIPSVAPVIVQSGPSRKTRAGETQFEAIPTPGHTPGALSWTWRSCEDEVCKTIVYADSLTPVSADDYRFSDHPEYLAAFRASLDRVAALDCDILLTPHPSASGMRDKLLAGDLTAGPTCREYAAALRQRLDERLAEEARAR